MTSLRHTSWSPLRQAHRKIPCPGVCVCVFVDFTSASLFWSILVLFPHKLSHIFQTPGTSNGIKPYHISHSAGGWGAAIRNSSQLQSSFVPLGVYIFDLRSIFSSSLGSLTHPHTLSPSHKPDHTITEPLQIIIINTPTQKKCVSFNPSPWRSHTPCLNSHSFPNGWAKDVSNQANSYGWNIKEEW